MIGHDKIDTEPLRGFRRRESANPCVDADDETHTGRGGALDDIIFHAITFADAVRHMEIRRASAKLNRSFENDDRGGPIDVIVAVDEDSLFALDSRVEAVDCGLHPAHGVRRM